DRRDLERSRRPAAGGDLPGDARRVSHSLEAEVLAVGIAGRVTLEDADAEPHRNPAPDRLDPLLLEDVVGRHPVLEVQIGVVAAALERPREETTGDGRVDLVLAAGTERRAQEIDRGAHRRSLTLIVL